MREYEINMLNDTLHIVESGAYRLNGAVVPLRHSAESLREAQVFLPDELEEACRCMEPALLTVEGACTYSCENTDTYSAARKMTRERLDAFVDGGLPVLVLNLANPVHPGGGVRRGAHAQEEDLCRKSSLLVSLESEAAKRYYTYNSSQKTYMGTDAIVLSPTVEIIKDEAGALLPEPVTVAVLTCAAPMITAGIEGMTVQEYRDMFFHRIAVVLKFAAAHGYRDFVLGAWGCGAFGNDAALVSDLFLKAFKELNLNGRTEKELFRHIDFAVLCRHDDYNYRQFQRNFGTFARNTSMKEITLL